MEHDIFWAHELRKQKGWNLYTSAGERMEACLATIKTALQNHANGGLGGEVSN